MLRNFVLAICLACAALVAHAQSRFLASPEEARKAADGMTASLAAGNYAGALKELRPLSVIPPTEFDLFEAQVNNQLTSMLRQMGAPNGYEFLREDRLGSKLIREQFFVFHEKAALRWTFVFYKAEKGWVVSHFVFEANALQFFPSGG